MHWFTHPALRPQVALPEGAVRRAAGHGAQEERINFYDFLDGLTRDVGPHGRSTVDGDDDAAVKLEG